MDNHWKAEFSAGERTLWERLLGKKELEVALAHLENDIPREAFLKKGKSAAFMENCLYNHQRYESPWLQEKCFYPFYEPMIGFAESMLLESCALLWQAFGNMAHIKLMELLFSRLEQVSLRILVSEMGEMKAGGILFGDTPDKEYLYYVNKYLKDGTYRKAILEKYPALQIILCQLITNFVTFIEDFTEHLSEDFELLCDTFWKGERPHKVTMLEPGISDAHYGGRTVIKVIWDDFYTLYYKPRSVKNDVMYQALYQWMASACGVEIKNYELLDRGNHGWCAPINPGACEDESQVQVYFKRLGIELFLSYLFSVKDLHCDNILAWGPYPVFVDMETFPGISSQEAVSSIKDLALAKITGSVMLTGALPVTIWNFDGHGVRMGALGSEGKQKLSMKVPVIINGKTSDMKVVLAHPEFVIRGNLPTLPEKQIHPADYVTDLIWGFNKAYSYTCTHKDLLLEQARAVFVLNSRVLLRNTQQYSMYIQTGSSPFFMTALWRQQLFFTNLYRGTNLPDKWKDAIVSYETVSLWERDIPYFYMNGLRTSLFDSQGNEYENFFSQSPMEAFRNRLESLGEKDCRFQERLIELSMAALPDGRKSFVNTWEKRPWEKADRPKQFFENYGDTSGYGKALNGALSLGQQLLDFAVVDFGGREMIWTALKYFGLDEMDWRLDVQNMYLYDGLAGIGLFLSVLGWLSHRMDVLHSFRCIREQLFNYTEELLRNGCGNAPMGIFNGEASLIYVYLIWYKLFHDPLYLIYGKKHSEVLEKKYKEDKNLDIISGNAGLMIAWLHLYDITGEMKYLHLSVDAGHRLIAFLEETDVGAGFVVAGEKVPLGGISHGSSGFMVAFARLYARSGEPAFAACIQKLLAHEASLFDNSIGNWRDLRTMKETASQSERQGGQSSDAVAWCHGAPGILLARLEVKKNCPDLETKCVERDIRRALEKLSTDIYRSGFCLCHGNLGNSWIAVRGAWAVWESATLWESLESGIEVKEAAELFYNKTFADTINRINTGEFLPQEKYNPGFMTGISGMGYALLRECCGELPDVLAMEIS